MVFNRYLRMILVVGCCVSGSVILKGADLVISGDYAVAADGEAYDNITVGAAATISGGAITLANGGTISVSAGTARFTCPIVLGSVQTAGITIAPASGATATFEGVLSGAADIDINGAGTIYFKGANTFDGNMVITKGIFHGVGDGAFGSDVGSTTLTTDGSSSAAKIYFEGGTWSENFNLSQGGTWGNWTITMAGTCVFNGTIRCTVSDKTQWWYAAQNANITFNGAFNNFWGFYGEGVLPYTINWNSSPCITKWSPKAGTHIFTQPFNVTYAGLTCARTLLSLRGGTIDCRCADVFGPSGNCSRYYVDSTVSTATTLILAEDQHVSYINGVNTSAHTFTSENGKTFHADSTMDLGVSSQSFAGTCAGNINLSVDGPLPLSLSGIHTTSGALILTNGAQVTMSSGSAWVGKIDIAANGGEVLTVNGGASMAISELWIGGEKVADGYYGGKSSTADNTYDCFAGSGVITVGTPGNIVTASWTGGGTTAAITEGANWSDKSEPANDGSTAITFAAGTEANLTHDVSWKSVTFADIPYFRIWGTGLLTLAEGFSFASSATAGSTREYVIDVPYAQTGSKTISVPEGVTLTFSNSVSVAANTAYGFNGMGTIAFHAANTIDGDLFLGGNTKVVATHADAFGDAESSISISTTGTLDFQNVTIPGAVTLSDVKTFVTPNPVTNIFAGPVTLESGTTKFLTRHGQRYAFRDGIALKNSGTKATLALAWDSGCTTSPGNTFALEISGKPITGNGYVNLSIVDTYVNVYLAVSSNHFGDAEHQISGNGFLADKTSSTRFYCEAPFAFNYDSSLFLGISGSSKDAGYFDLGGYDQGFKSAVGFQKKDEAATWDSFNVVHSETPAFLCTRHTTFATNRWTFTGAAGYRMEGKGSVTLVQSSASTGDLCVTNGTLTLAASCSWSKCRQATASGTGTLKIESANALGKNTDIYVSDEARIHLDDDVIMRANALYLNGVEHYGTWGSLESVAQHKDAHFTGGGVVRFIGKSFVIIVR